jgi:hypothetical protein
MAVPARACKTCGLSPLKNWRRLPEGGQLCWCCWGRRWRAERYDRQVAQVIAAVVTAEPALTVEAIASCIETAAPTRWYMTTLADALIAERDCLTSGGSTAPVVVDRLVGALVEVGATAVRPPVCADCGGTKWLNQNFGGLRVCQRCAGWRRAEPCHRCNNVAPVSVRNDAGMATCRRCRMADPARAERCSECRRLGQVARRTAAGAVCPRCYRHPIARCEICGRTRALFGHHEGPSALQWLLRPSPRRLRVVCQGGQGGGRVGRPPGVSDLLRAGARIQRGL